jgi:hypothetical protein
VSRAGGFLHAMAAKNTDSSENKLHNGKTLLQVVLGKKLCFVRLWMYFLIKMQNTQIQEKVKAD